MLLRVRGVPQGDVPTGIQVLLQPRVRGTKFNTTLLPTVGVETSNFHAVMCAPRMESAPERGGTGGVVSGERVFCAGKFLELCLKGR